MNPYRIHRPLVVAHRGASSAWAENTMPAFSAARRLRADAIELDIQLTRDGVPIVYHDRTLGKLSGSRRPVSEHTLAELRRWDFTRRHGPSYRGISVPTLDEVLDRFGGQIPLMLEIKADGERPRSERWHRLVDGVVSAVEGRALDEHVHILSFQATVLRAVRRRAPKLSCVLNVGERVAWSPAIRRALQPMRALCLPSRFATAALGHEVHRRGCQLWTYRCDTRRAVQRAMAAKADALITDDPAWLRDRLQELDTERAPSRSRRVRARSRALATPE